MRDSQQIEVLARGVCVKDGKLLLCHTAGADNTYLPGGHVEFVEETAESLRREIDEEMGVHADVKRFLGAVEHTFVQEGVRRCEINLVFEMDIDEIDSSANPHSCESHIDFCWHDMDDLENSYLEPKILRTIIHDWIRHESQPERWATA